MRLVDASCLSVVHNKRECCRSANKYTCVYMHRYQMANGRSEVVREEVENKEGLVGGGGEGGRNMIMVVDLVTKYIHI